MITVYRVTMDADPDSYITHRVIGAEFISKEVAEEWIKGIYQGYAPRILEAVIYENLEEAHEPPK